MRKTLTALLICSYVLAWTLGPWACKQPDKKADTAEVEKLGLLAVAAVTPDSIKITPGGDTLKYYHTTKTGSYTYDVPYVVVLKGGGGTLPPDTTDPGPDPEPPTNTFNVSFTQIPFSDPDLNRPAGGAEQWHDRNDVNLGYTPKDVYYRFVWTRLEGATQGAYNWSYIDGLINAAIDRGQKFSFGIMTVYPDGTTNEGLINIPAGGTAAYPLYLHNAMMAESVKAWRTGNTWTPNYNSAFYSARLLALHQALSAHFNTTSYKGKLYKDVIGCIDIRGYGAWGEWHSGYTPNNNVSDYPAGTFPTVASLKKIVDAHTQGFANFQLVCMIAGFDAMWLNNTKNPNEIAHYLLTQRNARGLIGWRRDQWGATDNYLKDYLENNNRSFNGLVFKDSIMVRYKNAPITGEPPSWNPNEYADLERQIRLYGASSFGNGNYGTAITTTLSNRVKASSKAAGHRMSVTSAKVETAAGQVGITLNWTNTGISPTYENWSVYFDLVNPTSGAVVQTLSSKYSPRLLAGARAGGTTDGVIQAAARTSSDIFTGLPAGTYRLIMRVAEPYRGNLPLFLREKQADGSVILVNSLKI